MKKKILIIEDEKELYFRLINRLSEYYDVEIARSVSAAKYCLNSNEGFDLIFLDAMMSSDEYTLDESDEGTETGWVFYEKELKNKKVKIVVWTKNNQIFSKPWGENVVEKVLKSAEQNQLVDIANRHIRN